MSYTQVNPVNEKETERRRRGEQNKNKIAPTFLLFHDTKGNEKDPVPLTRKLPSKTDILNRRGKVLENGVYPRFFRRLAEGFLIQKN